MKNLQHRARRAARHGTLSTLALTWRRRGLLEECVRRPRVHFPYLHSVPRHEEGRFRELLDWLATSHTFVSYSDAVQRVISGAIDRPYVAFSFDDGFSSNVRTAQILEEYGATGCFFVATGFIGTPTLAEARAFFGYSEGIDEPAMTWDQLTTLKDRGHEIGNHTCSHRRISDLPTQEMIDEVGNGREMLQARLGGADHFAWPFGRFFHFTDQAAAEVYRSGHRSCASAERGAHVARGGSRVCLRRDHLMTSWPLLHQQLFLARSARFADASTGGWPVEWEVGDG